MKKTTKFIAMSMVSMSLLAGTTAFAAPASTCPLKDKATAPAGIQQMLQNKKNCIADQKISKGSQINSLLQSMLKNCNVTLDQILAACQK